MLLHVREHAAERTAYVGADGIERRVVREHDQVGETLLLAQPSIDLTGQQDRARVSLGYFGIFGNDRNAKGAGSTIRNARIAMQYGTPIAYSAAPQRARFSSLVVKAPLKAQERLSGAVPTASFRHIRPKR